MFLNLVRAQVDVCVKRLLIKMNNQRKPAKISNLIISYLAVLNVVVQHFSQLSKMTHLNILQYIPLC